MPSYTAEITTIVVRRDETFTDLMLDRLAGYSPAIAWDDQGRVVVTVSMETANLHHATSVLLTQVQQAVGEVVHVDAMTSDEYDTRAEVPV